MPFTLRLATVDDAAAVADVHVATWRAAYPGIVPQAHLDALSVHQRAARWRDWIAEPSDPATCVWLADDGARIVGFANAGPSRDVDGGGLGELRAIYVLPGAWEMGLGRRLHGHAVASLRAAGFTAASLWVFEANARARRFYEGRGWTVEGARRPVDLGGASIPEIRYRLDLAGRVKAG